MQSIEKEITHAIMIQKSKFICKLIPVQSVEEIKRNLKEVQKEFEGATHYCYAYICGNMKKCSDDGEPSGTAGIPILNVLEKRELNDILCIVIRYFGGIKLGAGGLVRAYCNAVTETLHQASIINLVLGKEIMCTFPYANEKQIQYLLNDAFIKEKRYQEEVIYQVAISNKQYESIIKALKQYANITIQKEMLVKKL